MIQFNLLPEVKVEFLKARRLKRLVILISTIVSGVSLAIFIFSFLLVNVAQKRTITNLSNTITTTSSKVTSTPNLNKILTIQNQLQSLPALNNEKPVASRLFGYIAQTTPAQVSMSNLSVTFATGNLSIVGTADTVTILNTYVDTLKFSTYTVKTNGNESKPVSAFTNVVLTSFSLSTTGQAGFTISAVFAPTLFNASDNVTLNVPNAITTRSECDQPTQLFQTQPIVSNCNPGEAQ